MPALQEIVDRTSDLPGQPERVDDAALRPLGELGPHDSLRRLVCSSPSESYAAAARLVGSGIVRLDQCVLVLVAGVADDEMDTSTCVSAGLAVQHFVTGCELRSVLHAVWADHAVCLVASSREVLAGRGPQLGADLHACLQRAWGGRHAPIVGVGSVSSSLADAAESYTHARWAAHVAARMPENGPVGRWDELGVFQLLRTIDSANVLPAGLEALFACANASMLLETLEAYLDTGGDAQATAAQLCLARGSLYYRLRRIEELAHVDLRDGRERLTLHLGLKLARLAGRWGDVRHDALRLVS
jgi:sugar diacid utilization regulator